ncbi:MAG: hypothetical protein PHS14_16810, partial [Elusimicrobia bacterium]|nr:hypothetical protein [Elusimicrobiota bacterium]
LVARKDDLAARTTQAAALDVTLAGQREQLAAIAAEGRGLAEQIRTAEGRASTADQRVNRATGALAEARRKVGSKADLQGKVARLVAARGERGECSVRIQNADSAIAEQRAELDRIARENQEIGKTRGEILAEQRRVTAEKAGLVPLITGHRLRTGVMDTVPCIMVEDLAERCPLLADARQSLGILEGLLQKQSELSAWTCPVMPELQQTTLVDATLKVCEATKTTAQRTAQGIDREIASLQAAESALASLDTVAAEIPGLEAEELAARGERDAASESLVALKGGRDAKAAAYRKLDGEIKANQTERATLDEAVRLLPEAELATRELPGLEAEIATIEQEVSGLQAKLAGEAEFRGRVDGAQQDTDVRRRAIAEGQARLLDCEQAEREAMQDAATKRAELARLDGLVKDRETAAADARDLRERHTRLAMLADAYRQIPLMILEGKACPILEEEVNAFLAKVSRNRMSVRIETQRELKSKETVDGLEIYVRDWRGERSLDEYSGGQVDELAIAFRVAWTRLQERRSGAGIDTLFLDEVFAALSETDLDAVLAALREVQNEFEFLGVISHVPKLRDVFPCQVRVTGGQEDSRAELVTA